MNGTWTGFLNKINVETHIIVETIENKDPVTHHYHEALPISALCMELLLKRKARFFEGSSNSRKIHLWPEHTPNMRFKPKRVGLVELLARLLWMHLKDGAPHLPLPDMQFINSIKSNEILKRQANSEGWEATNMIDHISVVQSSSLKASEYISMIPFLCCGLSHDPITSNKSRTMPSCYGHLWSSEKPLLGTLHYKCFWVLLAEDLKVKGKKISQDQKSWEKRGHKGFIKSDAVKKSQIVLRASNALKPDWQQMPHSCPLHVDISAKTHSCFVHGPLQSAATLAFAMRPVGVVPTKGIDFSDAFHFFSHAICNYNHVLCCSAIYHHILLYIKCISDLVSNQQTTPMFGTP